MSQRKVILLVLVAACAAYAPIGMYLFDHSLSTMLDRAYFTICGAAVALYAYS